MATLQDLGYDKFMDRSIGQSYDKMTSLQALMSIPKGALNFSYLSVSAPISLISYNVSELPIPQGATDPQLGEHL